MKPRRSAADGTGGITGACGRIRKKKKVLGLNDWRDCFLWLIQFPPQSFKKKNKNVNDNR